MAVGARKSVRQRLLQAVRWWERSGRALREKGLMGFFWGGGLQAEAAEDPGVKAFPRTGQKNGYDSVVGVDFVDQSVGGSGRGEAKLPEAL